MQLPQNRIQSVDALGSVPVMKSGRQAGKDTFELRGKKFEKRLNRAIKRDLTPIDADRTNGHAK